MIPQPLKSMGWAIGMFLALPFYLLLIPVGIWLCLAEESSSYEWDWKQTP